MKSVWLLVVSILLGMAKYDIVPSLWICSPELKEVKWKVKGGQILLSYAKKGESIYWEKSRELELKKYLKILIWWQCEHYMENSQGYSVRVGQLQFFHWFCLGFRKLRPYSFLTWTKIKSTPIKGEDIHTKP